MKRIILSKGNNKGITHFIITLELLFLSSLPFSTEKFIVGQDEFPLRKRNHKSFPSQLSIILVAQAVLRTGGC